MGWTWGGAGSILNLYPSLASSPVLLDKWPGFKETVEDMRAKGLLPLEGSAPDTSTTTKSQAKPSGDFKKPGK